jgi:cardiolipin synthase
MADQESDAYPLPDIDGHSFRLLPGGPERLVALLDLIEGARESVKLAFYIFATDDSSVRVRDALAAAAGRGVRVSLLVDDFGAMNADDAFLAPLVAAGGRVSRYEIKRSRRYLLRNHQKIALADDCRAMIGGFNVEDCYFAPDGGDGWRDLGLWLEGPAALRLARYFDALEDWTGASNARMRDLRSILLEHSEQDGDVRWLFGGPTRELSPWAMAFNRDLESAAAADIAAAYFAPYGALLKRIRRSAMRGHARLITASLSDNYVTVAAARNRYQYLLPEVEIYEYGAMKFHTKLYVIDDVTYIGSANLDVRSLYLNLEIMLRIRDRGFAEVMRRYIGCELAGSERITPEAYAETQGWWNRVKGRLAYLLMSVIDYNVTRRLNFGLDGK